MQRLLSFASRQGLSSSARTVVIGDRIKLSNYFLRDNCPCVNCLHQTGQRLKTPNETYKLISNSVDVRNVEILQTTATAQAMSSPSCHLQGRPFKEPHARITWNDGHVSEFSLSWLEDHQPQQDHRDHVRYRQRQLSQHFWNNSPTVDKMPQMEYAHVVGSEAGIHQWLRNLSIYGICKLNNAPREAGLLQRFAGRIGLGGGIYRSIYGDVWELLAKGEQADNVAYSNVFLELHMDLCYYESPPFVQLLHCLQFDEGVAGGLSHFADGFGMAETFRRMHPRHFHTLATVPATFHKADEKHAIAFERCHFDVSDGGGGGGGGGGDKELTAMYWSPPFEGPLSAAYADRIEDYYLAYSLFSDLVRDSKSYLSFRAAPGDILTFCNRRILHGRTAFAFTSKADNRHFQGMYISREDFLSRFTVLERKYGAA